MLGLCDHIPAGAGGGLFLPTVCPDPPDPALVFVRLLFYVACQASVDVSLPVRVGVLRALPLLGKSTELGFEG